MDTSSGPSMLIAAAKRGDADEVRTLLTNGADPDIKTVIYANNKDDDGQTALTYASAEGHIEVAELLLAYGADIHTKTEFDNTPIIYASEEGRAEIVRRLLDRAAEDKGIDIKNFTNDALVRASEKGQLEVVRLLLARGGDANAKNQYGNVALIEASRNGYVELVKLLLAYGADVNAKDASNMSALTGASGLVTWAVPCSDVAYFKKNRCTISTTRFSSAHFEVANLLITSGARVNDKDNSGNTAIMLASLAHQAEIVKLLIASRADVNLRTNDDETILMNLAKFGGSIDVMRLLLRGRIDVDAKDKHGNSALTYALRHACPSEMVVLLRRANYHYF